MTTVFPSSGDAADDMLLRRILGRPRSLFADDVEAAGPRLVDAIAGRRLLVVGAGGSIGSAFVKAALDYTPTALHLADVSENGLVELVRDLRSSPRTLPGDFLTASLDYGATEFERFALHSGPYDAFVNFAALKHVRAERDVYSLLRMIDVNVVSLHRCLDLAARLGVGRIFSVSTDKSVRPANLMGATKNLMEKVLFQESVGATATSARFANVAFSAGSLLESFEYRLRKRQPLSAPTDVRRYFISNREAGELCLLACFSGARREVFFPKLADRDLRSFSDIAVEILAHYGYEPRICQSEAEAIATPIEGRKWPCFFSASDTTGEKAVEEFHRPNDVVDGTRFRAAAVAREAPSDPAAIERFLAEIARIRRSSAWEKAEVVAVLCAAVPELDHREVGRNLDQKM